jgi:hypothetical protein
MTIYKENLYNSILNAIMDFFSEHDYISEITIQEVFNLADTIETKVKEIESKNRKI